MRHHVEHEPDLLGRDDVGRHGVKHVADRAQQHPALERVSIRAKAAAFDRRPRVFFEEWDSPLISGICWVDELVEIAGGSPRFPALRKESLAKNRIVSPDDVASRDPEVIIASWCGKAMKKRTIVERPGWDHVSAVRADHIYEIKSTYILQPGPAALTEGVARLHQCIARAVRP